MPLKKIRQLVQADFDAVNDLIKTNLHSQIGLIEKLSQHLINSGGKRMRPLIVLLSAKACQYQGDAHVKLAAAVEYFHTATLLHDDVIDESILRRGQETANQLWGDKSSILVGDFLFTQAFQLMVVSGNLQVLAVLADAANVITCGEVQQLANCNNPDIDEAAYFEVIRKKTAILFSASAQIGPILAHQSSKDVQQALADYGLHLGNAFQLTDDALDYCADSQTIGKNIGDDLAEGKPTLPLIYALKHGTPTQQSAIRQAIKQGSLDQLPLISEALKQTQAIEYTYQVAQQEVNKAIDVLAILNDSVYKTALIELAEFAVARQH